MKQKQELDPEYILNFYAQLVFLIKEINDIDFPEKIGVFKNNYNELVSKLKKIEKENNSTYKNFKKKAFLSYTRAMVSLNEVAKTIEELNL